MKLLDAYPIFEPNQVLSYEHLNQLTDFMVSQERVARRALVGKGVFCGLQVQSNIKSGIWILGGGGLTSEGRLYVTDTNLVFDRCQRYEFPVEYAPFKSGPKAYYEAWELLLAGAKERSESRALIGAEGAQFLKDKVVCLHVEESVNDLDRCLQDHCINQGKEQQLNWKFLLFSKPDARAIRGQTATPPPPSEAELKARFNKAFRLPAIDFERCLLSDAAVTSYERLAIAFESAAARSVREQLLAAVETAIKSFGPPLSIPNASSYSRQGLQESMALALESVMQSKHVGIQHFWDNVRHLYEAYQAFQDAAFGWVSRCLCDPNAFPRHIFLGAALGDEGCEPSIYRHHFVPSPAVIDAEADRKRARLALDRLVKMTESFALPKDGGLRATPGALPALPLDDRAVPFYYPPAAVLSNWSYEAAARCQSDRLPSYHREALSSAPAVQDPLRFSLRGREFLRIENHQGKPTDEVEKELERLRRDYNLPIKVARLRFGEADAEADDECCCALEELRLLYLLRRDEIKCQLSRLMAYLTDVIERRKKERDAQTEPEPPGGPKPARDIDILISRYDPKLALERYEIRYDLLPDVFGPIAATASISSSAASKASFEKSLAVEETRRDAAIGTEDAAAIADAEKRIKEMRAAISGATATSAAAASSQAIRIDYLDMVSGIRSVRDKGLGIDISYVATPERLYESLPPLKLANSLFQELLGRISETDAALAEDLLKFDLPNFQIQLDQLRAKAKHLRDLILSALDAKEPSATNAFPLQGFELTLAQQLTAFLSHCSAAALGGLVTRREEQLKLMESRQTLAHFFRQHPGIEHASGVPLGGTFIIVSGTPAQLNRRNPLVDFGKPPVFDPTVRPKKPELNLFESFANAFRDIIALSGPTATSDLLDVTKKIGLAPNPNSVALGSIARLSPKSEAVGKFTAREDIAKLLYSNPIRDTEVEKLTREAAARLADLGRKAARVEEVVLADFFLPYLCCSDCASVEYIVMPEVSLRLPTDIFMTDDETAHPFEALPPGGLIDEAPGVSKIEGRWYFTPKKSNAPAGSITFKYTFADRSASFTAKLVEPEQEEEDPTLELIDGKQPFCPNDGARYRLLAKPEGGAISGAAFAEPNFFIPSQASQAEKDSGKAALRYALENGQEATLEIGVQKPVAVTALAGEPTQTEKGQSVRFEAQIDGEFSRLEWVFADGIKTDQRSFVREFTQSGTYTASLFVAIGECIEHAEVSVTIEIRPREPEAPEIKILEGEPPFCFHDERPYQLVADQEGTFSGHGVATQQGNAFFTPINIPASALAKGIAVIQFAVKDGQTYEKPVQVEKPPVISVGEPKLERSEKGWRATVEARIDPPADRHRWEFEDGFRSEEATLVRDFEMPGKFSGRIIAIAGPCIEAAEFVVEIPRLVSESTPPTVSIPKHPGPFCANDDTYYVIEGKPDGGKFSGDGVATIDEVGRFRALSVAGEARQKGKARVAYLAPDGQSAAIEVELVEPPQLFPTASAPQRGEMGWIVILGVEVNGRFEKAVWTLPDGGQLEGTRVSAVFARTGRQVVRLAVSAPPCVARAEIPVDIETTPTQPTPGGGSPGILTTGPGGRLADLRENPRMTEIVGTENTAIYKTARALESRALAVAADPAAAKDVARGAQDDAIGESAVAAFNASFNRVAKSVDTLGESDLLYLWEFNQLALVNAIELAAVRATDIKSGDPIDAAFKVYAEQAKALKSHDASKSLRLDLRIETQLKDASFLADKPNLRESLQAIAKTLK